MVQDLQVYCKSFCVLRRVPLVDATSLALPVLPNPFCRFNRGCICGAWQRHKLNDYGRYRGLLNRRVHVVERFLLVVPLLGSLQKLFPQRRTQQHHSAPTTPLPQFPPSFAPWRRGMHDVAQVSDGRAGIGALIICSALPASSWRRGSLVMPLHLWKSLASLHSTFTRPTLPTVRFRASSQSCARSIGLLSTPPAGFWSRSSETSLPEPTRPSRRIRAYCPIFFVHSELMPGKTQKPFFRTAKADFHRLSERAGWLE